MNYGRPQNVIRQAETYFFIIVGPNFLAPTFLKFYYFNFTSYRPTKVEPPLAQALGCFVGPIRTIYYRRLKQLGL